MKSVDLITGFDASEEPTANIASIPPPVTVDHRKAEDRFGSFFKYLIDAFLGLNRSGGVVAIDHNGVPDFTGDPGGAYPDSPSPHRKARRAVSLLQVPHYGEKQR